MPLEPDRDQIELFVDALFRHASPGAFLSLRAFYEDRGEARPFIIVPVKLNGDFTVVCNIVTDAARTAANATEKVVFAPPLVTFHDARKATEKDIADAIVLSVECDARPQQSREKLEAMLGPATVVTRSGGRWIDPKTGASYDKLHLHWRLAEPATGKADLARLRRARNLACRIVGADPSGKSIVHPYRWPGSWHRKAEPRLCEIEHAEPDHEIVLEEALEHLEDAAGAVRDGDGGGLEHHAREGYRVEWEDAFRTILTGESYHPTLVPLAASFAAWGMPEPAADNVLRCLLINSKPQDADRERRRQTELQKLPETISSAYAKFGENKEGNPHEEGPELHWHGEAGPGLDRDWLVDGLLPQTGTGLISGQWGVYKTFVGLDLAAAIMAGLAFIDYPVTQRGGVLFIAAEGASEIPIRLQAVLAEKYPDIKRAPFAWIDNCPRLLAPKAVETLTAIARKAAEHMQAEFGIPLALILIDTVVDAAGYTKPGDENDAALAQRIMRCCADLSRQTGALVIGIDHFGKAVETGTRGSSAKEGRADVVLALLGDKAITGEVTNTRFAVRKNRAGPSGRELPFTVRTINLGTDHNDRPLTSLIVDWTPQQDTPTRPLKEQGDGWSKSLRLLRQALMNTLVDQGKDMKPWADGPSVRAVNVEVVRAEFYRCYLAEGDTPDAKKAARQKAFKRAVNDAQARGLIGICNIEGETVMWLAHPKDGPAQNA
jgi:hypothetical protein